MDKNEFASFLTKRGYPSAVESGVVKINAESTLTKADEKTVQNLMREAGYNASYAYKIYDK